ncbi:MAG: type II CAAX endopeptidase family protein, partial [Planctomycetota bacterium]
EFARCSYCGRALDLRYTFCVHCASTHDVTVPANDLGEEESDEYWDIGEGSIETRLMRRAPVAVNYFLALLATIIFVGVGTTQVAEDSPVHAIFLQHAAVAGLTLFFALSERRLFADLFVVPRSAGILIASVPLLAGFLVINHFYHSQLTELFGLEDETSLIDLVRREVSKSTLVVVICVLPAVLEETGFRGLVQTRFVETVGKASGFAATSVLFTALHFSVLSAPYLFLLSLYLCWVRDRTGSLYPVIVLHFLHNLAVLWMDDAL